MLLKVDRARIVRARGFYRSEDLVAAWTALEARAKATGARLDNLELPGSKVQDPERFTVLNSNVPFQVKISLRCRHFNLGGELIGRVAAGGCRWQMKLISPEELGIRSKAGIEAIDHS